MEELEELTIKPHGERVLSLKFPNARVELESGNVQVYKRTVNPIKVWELKFSGSKEEGDQLESFFERKGGGATPFLWRTMEDDGSGEEVEVIHTVRFEIDELPITKKRGHREDGTFGYVAYEATLKIRKVWE